MPIQNQSILENLANVHAGLRVDAAAALIINGAGVGRPIFTIAGGNVMLLALYGECMTTVRAGAVTLEIDCVPTVGTTTIIATASANLVATALGQMLHLPAFAGALTVTAGCGASSFSLNPNYVVRPGTINALATIDPATGTFRWSAFYMPIDPGSYMVGS